MPQRRATELVVETDQGLFVRLVRAARTVTGDDPLGLMVEDAVRDASADFGLPDFVFRPLQVAKGAATRERGDALVVVSRQGLSIQVKTRSTGAGTAERERAWLVKNVGKGVRQALGTVRALTGDPTCTLVNGRGTSVNLPWDDVDWLPVVIVDHPELPSGFVPAEAYEHGTVVITRSDWEFLYEQLGSTAAVVGYLHRVSRYDVIELGDEPVRYYELAAEDAATPPSPLPPELLGNGIASSTPMLPQRPQAPTDHAALFSYRRLLEHVALSEPDALTPADRHHLLSLLDDPIVGTRDDLGVYLMHGRSDFEKLENDSIGFQSRIIRQPNGAQLIYCFWYAHASEAQDFFRAYVQLRHQQLVDATGDENLWTVGVMLTPSNIRPWDTSTVMTTGQMDLEPEYRQKLEEFFPLR